MPLFFEKNHTVCKKKNLKKSIDKIIILIYNHNIAKKE